MIAGVEKVLSMIPQDAKIIPGHGPLSTPADVRKLVQMLKDTRALVVQAANQGKSADQMKQDHVLAKYDSSSTVRHLPDDKFSKNAGFFVHVNRLMSKCSAKF